MKTPGVTVRPIITLDGTHEVNEVWLDDVRVPVENRVHEENKGWTCAKFLLSHERTGIAQVGRSKRGLEKLYAAAGEELQDGQPLSQDPIVARKIAELEIELMALEYTELRMLAGEGAGRTPGPESSLLKIKGSEIQQRYTELLMLAGGPFSLPFIWEAMEAGWQGDFVGGAEFAPLAANYFNYRKTTIYGGSNEVQRNIVAQTVLGV
jgi:hypothetical protein